MGYNAMTLDGVTHWVVDPEYPPSLRRKLDQYRDLYAGLFETAAQAGLRVFITVDLMCYDDTLRRRLGRSAERAFVWWATALDALLGEWSGIAGVIVRIGETDAGDVGGDFRSRPLLRTPRQARRFVSRLLPVFETHGPLLVLRTWSVGAHPIGDVMWSRRTFDRAFAGIESRSLVISMKYGETDSFRHLPLNPLFFHSPHQKLVEFQARREYERFGAYPSFVGWDCEAYLSELRSASNLVGASVWC